MFVWNEAHLAYNNQFWTRRDGKAMEWQHFYKWLTYDTEEAFSAFETETGLESATC